MLLPIIMVGQQAQGRATEQRSTTLTGPLWPSSTLATAARAVQAEPRVAQASNL
ncbi:MAG: hypothetical protein WAS07_02280 [Micropruina sp.]